MASARNENRPLSPHLQVWKWGPHMLVSILHRVTGSGMAAVDMAVSPFLAVDPSLPPANVVVSARCYGGTFQLFAERYAREADFDKWSHRLEVHGLDLRHAPSVEVFARHVAATHDRLPADLGPAEIDAAVRTGR